LAQEIDYQFIGNYSSILYHLFFGEDALGGLLILSQVVLSLQLGFAIIPLIHLNSDKKEMKDFTIKPWVKVLAWMQVLS
jgi:manganese transport protein